MKKLKVVFFKKGVPYEQPLEDSIFKDIIKVLEIEPYQFQELEKEEPNSEKYIDYQSLFTEYEQEITNQKEQPQSKKKIERPVFAAYFSLKNFNKPTEIDLSKVNKIELETEELESQIQSAYNKGFEDGQQVTQLAFAEEFKKMENWVKRIDEVIVNLNHEYSTQVFNLKEIIVPIAIKIAKHIIKSELKTNSSIIEKQVRKTLEIIDKEKVFQVKLNPGDVEILKMVGSNLLKDPKLEGVEIVADPTIEPGGCIVETETGMIDATVESQLTKIATLLSNISIDLEEKNV